MVPLPRFALLATLLLALIVTPRALAQDVPFDSSSPAASPTVPPPPAPIQREDAPVTPPAASLPPAPPYDDAIFQRRIPPAELKGLDVLAGTITGDAQRDRNLRRLVHSILPGSMFHYGRDMSPSDAFDQVLTGAGTPVRLREGRYLILSGDRGPYLRGLGMVWIDTQSGIGLAAFYFRPSNGEPSPTLTVFSRQIDERFDPTAPLVSIGELPPEFVEDLEDWLARVRIEPVTTRYFIGNNNKRLLLAHDEDFCAALSTNGIPRGADCEQLNADAADTDLTTAYYLAQVNYATNATAHMITGQDQIDFIQLRNNRCGTLADPLACRVRLTRERLRTVMPGMPSRPGRR